MTQTYIGPPSGVDLGEGGAFLLWPGQNPGLPAGHPYTLDLIAEGHLIATSAPPGPC